MMIPRRRKAPNPNVYKTFNITNPTCPVKGDKDLDYRPGIKQTNYSKYKTTSQIMNLPGGNKRNLNDVHDDQNNSEIRPCIKWDKPSYSTKIYKDYKSKVTCLPGSGTITTYRRQIGRPISFKRFQDNDIFNNKKNYSNDNSFIQATGKRFNFEKRVNQESSTTQQRAQGLNKRYKNYSQFQIV